MKIVTYFALKSYRLYLKGNLRSVVLIGNSSVINKLKTLFQNKKDLGYRIIAIFSSHDLEEKTGNLKDGILFLKNNNYIDEVYCAIDDLSENQINEYVKLASINHFNIKFIPKTQKLFTKRLKTEYYNYLPILSISDPTLNKNINVFIKRSFDICFSIFVIVFVLSWLSAIIYLLNKRESSAPLFYKHIRNGLNYKEFTCYKYRTLKTNSENESEYVKRDDPRVTKIGKILRSTSIDELPQFINVLLGDMSVVGPRPHMISFTNHYSKMIDKYSFIYRHSVKPGVTGLAQIKGYRGEVKSKEDIVNRIKYDNFYIENWSLLLDLKIIFQTLINVFKGDEKAY